MKSAADTAFLIYIKNAYPLNVLDKIKKVPEVCTVYAATANPLEVIIAETAQGRGIIGVVDGLKSKGIETDADIKERRQFLRKIGFSPYARSGYVSHVHTSMASILKTFDLTFQMGFLNQFDAAATDLSDFFTSQPDFTPYDTLPSDVRIFDPAKVREPGLDMKAQHGAPLDDPDTIRREMRKDDH